MNSMKTISVKIVSALVLATVSLAVLVHARDEKDAHGPAAGMAQPIFSNYADMKWEKILPDLGASSPEVCILHVDLKTQATKLMIRAPKAIHVRKHWHSGNETHTLILGTAAFACGGKKVELGPGSF